MSRQPNTATPKRAPRVTATATLLAALTALTEKVSTLEERLASPAVQVAPVEADNGFIAFLAERHAAALDAGTHVRCEMPGCKGIMNAQRTTRLTVGKRSLRACKRHFGRR